MKYRPLRAAPTDERLGRFIPDDFEHVEKYPFNAIARVYAYRVERTLPLPIWHRTHNQGSEGSCVGHGCAMERAITNSLQNKVLGIFRGGRRYDPLHIWNAAKEIDDWAETNPGDSNGTSVRAAYDILRIQGARRIKVAGINIVGDRVVVSDQSAQPDPTAGVETNRWAQNIDEIRTAIAWRFPVSIGVNWYSAFNAPVARGNVRKEFWLAPDGKVGRLQGGHCVCLYGASDRREAFKLKNSWGDYPLVWLPYSVMERLLGEYGEAALVTDR